MHQDLGIFDAIAGTYSGLFRHLFRHRRVGQTLNGSAFIANKMSVLMAGGAFEVAHPISPNLVIPPDPVK
jgi:hypothetical protein